MARAATAGSVMLAMGVVSGAQSAASAQAADVTMSYSCPFPSGSREVPVKITGSFPRGGLVGQPIRPGDVTITPALPRAALADLTKLDAAVVTASADLSVTVAQNGTSTKIAWPGLVAPSTPIPGSGDLRLRASGTVPSVKAKAIGIAVFLAGPLTLDLTPHKADGSATDPATLRLECTLKFGQNPILAAVSMSGPNAVTPPPGSGRARAALRTGARPADDPCSVPVDLPPPDGSVPGEAFLAGFSNVNKLNGASLIGRENGQTIGHTTLLLAYKVIINPCEGSFDLLSRGSLDDNGKPRFPPAKATFLTFGFMPTTATIELTQVPGTNLEIDSHEFPFGSDPPEKTTVTSQLSLHILSASVNGVPLDVGPRCETVRPLAVTLTGKYPDYTVNTGGPLTGAATIPPFSGCGVGEDLDPVFNASISGPGNFMKLTQGVPCTRPPGEPTVNCDPIDRPIPQP